MIRLKIEILIEIGFVFQGCNLGFIRESSGSNVTMKPYNMDIKQGTSINT